MKLKRTAGWLLLGGVLACWGQTAVVSSTGPDAESYGAAEGFPVGSRTNAFEKQYMVGSFSHFDSLFPFHTVSAAAQPWAFQQPIKAPQISYFHAGRRYQMSDYLAHLPVTALLIARDSQILFEAYQYARTDRDRFTSQSMVKTIVGMLAGVAASEHKLNLTDTPSTYLPELKDADYGKVTVKNLLHMSSGVTCQSENAPAEDITLQMLAQHCKQAVPQGTQFRYSAEDAQVLGLVLEAAVRMPLARYLQTNIWGEIGTQSKATWTINSSGQELAYCCFNATLRDYARFARLLAFDGEWNGKQLIPRQWVLDATSVSETDAQLAPGKPAPFFGYGYQVWIFPGPRRMFALLGANGQRIFVDPKSKLIMVQTAVLQDAMDLHKDAEMIGLWLSLVHRFGSQ